MIPRCIGSIEVNMVYYSQSHIYFIFTSCFLFIQPFIENGDRNKHRTLLELFTWNAMSWIKTSVDCGWWTQLGRMSNTTMAMSCLQSWSLEVSTVDTVRQVLPGLVSTIHTHLSQHSSRIVDTKSWPTLSDGKHFPNASNISTSWETVKLKSSRDILPSLSWSIFLIVISIRSLTPSSELKCFTSVLKCSYLHPPQYHPD